MSKKIIKLGPFGITVTHMILGLYTCSRIGSNVLTFLLTFFGLKVFSFNLGSENWVAICDYAILKEAFSKDAFNNRPSLGALDDFSFVVSNFYPKFSLMI